MVDKRKIKGGWKDYYVMYEYDGKKYIMNPFNKVVVIPELENIYYMKDWSTYISKTGDNLFISIYILFPTGIMPVFFLYCPN